MDEYKSIGNHWITLHVNGDNMIYFDSLGFEHITKENKKFLVNKSAPNIFGIQAHNSVICK